MFNHKYNKSNATNYHNAHHNVYEKINRQILKNCIQLQ